MQPSQFKPMIAVTLVLAMAFAFVPHVAMASVGASLSGRVFQADGITPRTGVTVSLVDDTTEGMWRSEPTRDNGGFRIEQAPAGSYTLVVETQEGAFISPEPVALQPGTNQPLALALNSSPNYKQDIGFGSGEEVGQAGRR